MIPTLAVTASFVLAFASSRADALVSPMSSISLRAGSAYLNPVLTGGSMLTIVNDTYPPGLGEPLNVILSADSDAAVLVDSTYNGGFQNYMLSTFIATECLGTHLGTDQAANLGDGDGNVTEIEELRWDFGNPYIGTCEETFNGGLHLRYWRQNSTGALFLAVSVEEDLNSGHDIVPNGYNLGRDYLVGNLTSNTVPSRNVTNSTTYSGSSSYGNYTYQTDVAYVSGLLNYTDDEINHYLTVATDGFPPIDGLVAVFTVKITAQPTTATSTTSNASPANHIASSLAIPAALAAAFWTIF